MSNEFGFQYKRYLKNLITLKNLINHPSLDFNTMTYSQFFELPLRQKKKINFRLKSVKFDML